MEGRKIGETTHFFDQISVVVVQLTDSLKTGNTVHFLGSGSDHVQEITSMQIEHETIETARKGDEVAIKVSKPVKPHAAVYLIEKE